VEVIKYLKTINMEMFCVKEIGKILDTTKKHPPLVFCNFLNVNLKYPARFVMHNSRRLYIWPILSKRIDWLIIQVIIG